MRNCYFAVQLSLLKGSGNEAECGTDKDWIKAQDRGGLLYVKETMYSLFLSIEDEVREHLQVAIDWFRGNCNC